MADKRGIIPRKIKGFRDIDPNLNQLKWKIIHAASSIYKLYGFEHWDTPILEYADNLGKYLPDTDTIEEGVYSFRNPEKEPVLKTDGKELRDEWDKVIMENHFLSLRYDLTAPLARLYAEKLWLDSQKGVVNSANAPMFRRYQYGPVYRYETKLDPGRFREFWQLDFDSVGTSNVASDAEVCMILSDAMEAIGLKRNTYVVKVNNRKVLKGFLQSIGIDTEAEEQAILRIIDKTDKIGLKGLTEELGAGRKDVSGAFIAGLKLPNDKIDAILSFLNEFQHARKRSEILDRLYNYLSNSPTGTEGVEELGKIDQILSPLGFDEERIMFEPTLIRGMGYYTGPVFEVESKQTFIDSKGLERKVGSICGGGRYDGLVERLIGIKVPATGASIGVDRLAELLQLTNQCQSDFNGPVFIAAFDDTLAMEYQRIAASLRAQNIEAEIYYGSQKGLKKQLAYADKRNSPFAVLIGENEITKGIATVKDLRLGKLQSDIQNRDEWKEKVQTEVKLDDLVNYLKNNLKK
ncbi:MAG TPA: histidine--tRNA ligase [Bacteroidales bacterium]|nr:histidine--tRNA ligase [Bacteroidales bacterium]